MASGRNCWKPSLPAYFPAINTNVSTGTFAPLISCPGSFFPMTSFITKLFFVNSLLPARSRFGTVAEVPHERGSLWLKNARKEISLS
jgi:hypothetical protein